MITRLLLLIFALCPPLFAAQPPPELTVLRQQYDKILAERVTAPFDAGLAELNTKYTAGLDRFIGEAKTAGELKTVLALEAEKKRLADKLPLPAEDDDSTPESLKKLRVIYREQFKKLEEARTANHAALLPAYTAKLAALEVTLTKADRVAEAAEVLTYREGLAAGGAATIMPVAEKTNPPAPAAAQTSSMTPSQAEAANRQLAEWCINHRHSLEVQVKRERIKIENLQQLPKERFEILKIDYKSALPVGADSPLPWAAFPASPGLEFIFLEFSGENINVTMADLAHLGALKSLRSLQFGGKAVWQDFDVKKLPPLPALTSLTTFTFTSEGSLPILHELFPKLTSIAFGFRAMAPAELEQLQLWPELRSLRIDSAASELTPAHITALAGMKALRELILYPFNATIDPSIKTLTSINNVNLNYDCPPATFQAICSMPGLTTLLVSSNKKLTDADFAAVSSLTKLTELKLWNMTGLTDASAAHITALKTLASLDLSGTPFTDAILPELAKMKKLKKLSVRKTSVTDTGAAAFKKQRPDIEFTR